MKIPIFICGFALILAIATAEESVAPRLDPEDFIGRFEALPAAKRLEGVVPIARLFAVKDPDAALLWAKSLTDVGERAAALNGVACGSKLDRPGALVKAVCELPLKEQGEVARGLFSKLADIDLGRALDEALAVSDPQIAARLVDDIFSSWEKVWSLPVEKVNGVSAVHLAPVRIRIVQSFARKWSEVADESETLDGALALIRDPADRNTFMGGVANHWSYSYPRAALVLLKRIPAAERSREDVSRVCNAAAAVVPAEALAVVLESPNVPSKGRGEDILQHVFGAAAEHDPDGAMKWLREHPDVPGHRAMVVTLAKCWAHLDSKTTLGWAATLAEDERVAALATAAVIPDSFYPPYVAAQIGPLITAAHADEAELQDSAYKVANEWAGSDPVATAAWISQFAPGKAQDRAVVGLMERWCRGLGETAAAARWVGSLSDPVARDRVSAVAIQVHRSL
ncbi:MAG: hypothetical protein QM755_13715 [Luteolibacter sp.]